MKLPALDRRITLRHNLKTALRIRLWKSSAPEQRSESVNLSERGILYATDSPPHIGTVVEVLLKMPEEITGEPTTEWLCSGHVVRIEPIDSPRGRLGVGVQFDCYQKARNLSPETDAASLLRGGNAGRVWPIRATNGPSNEREWTSICKDED
jgi:hypothetical protein